MMRSGKTRQSTNNASAQMEKPSHVKYEAAVCRHLVDFKSCRSSLRVSAQNVPTLKVALLFRLSESVSWKAISPVSNGSISPDLVILTFRVSMMASKQIVQILASGPKRSLEKN